jgi:hypothetical protein
MKKTKTGFVLVAFLILSGSAFAQLKFQTDYTVSDAVWSVTHVKVKSNMIPHYLEGIRQTWVTGNEVAKELGQIEDYAIYSSILGDSGDYNLTLVIEFKDLAQYDSGRKNFKEFEQAWLKKISEQESETIVKTYPDMREIVGEHLVRKLDFLK